MRRLFKRFSLFHLLLIAILAALGIGVKSVVVPLVHLITNQLFIPGGAVAGGIYMLFIVLAASLTHMPLAGCLCGITQGIMVMLMGSMGNHGILSLVTYMLPGIAVDLVFCLLARKEVTALACFFAGIGANIMGTLSVNLAFFSMPLIPLLLTNMLGALTGAFGGMMAWKITEQLKKMKVID